jgi:chromosomal replication initiator protein
LHDSPGKQIVLASDRPPHELVGHGRGLRSRFASGLLVDIRAPDAALRRSLVEPRPAALGIDPAAHGVRHLAEDWCHERT